MDVVMSMQRDHQVEEPDDGALALVLWMSAALVGMVVFSYWLNAV
jgi:hypothetical protein